MARFSEVFRCFGADESPNVPGKSKFDLALQADPSY